MFYESKIDSNSDLANKLKGKYYPSKTKMYTVEEVTEVDKLTGVLLKNLVKTLFPDQLENPDFTPVMVSSKQGAFDKVYGPLVVKEDDQIVVSAGLVQAPIKLEKGEIKIPGLEIECDIVSTTFNGYDDTPCFSMSIYKPDENGEDGKTFAYWLPIRFRKLAQDEKYPSVKELSTMLKRKPKDLLSWLGDPPKPSMPTVAAKQLPVDEYDVVGYSFFTTSDNRESGVMIIKGKVDDSGLFTQEYIDPDDVSRETYIPLEWVSVYMPKELMGSFQLNPVVSEEYPATFSVRSVKPGKKPNSFRVESGFILNENAPKPVEEAEEDLSFLEL